MTKEQLYRSGINRKKATKFFNLQSGYVLHHIDPSWRHDDIERYIQWNPEDLVVMTRAEHTRLHQKGNTNTKGQHLSEEHKRKISKAKQGKPSKRKGQTMSDEAKIKMSKSHTGLKSSEETCRKIAEDHIGRHWYNNGTINKFVYECPEGFVAGRIYKRS